MESPTLTANLKDQSRIDDSTKQESVVINASDSATINNNSGNERARHNSSFTQYIIASFGVVMVGLITWLLISTISDNQRFIDRLSSIPSEVSTVKSEVSTVKSEVSIVKHDTIQMKDDWKKDANVNRECLTWIISNSIHRKIEECEKRGYTTASAYKWMKKEYDYYTNTLKGNHGVQEKMAELEGKILSGEVKVLKERPKVIDK